MLAKILQKYRNLNAPIKASFWFLICGFLQKAISMLTTPIFTRVMTESEYGRYNVYTSWFNIISIIVSLNLAAGVYTRGLIKYDEDEDAFSSSMMGLSTFCIIVGFFIYLFFKDFFNSILDLTTFLSIMLFVETWITSVFQFWSNRERVHYRYKKLVAITFLYVILSPILGVIGVLNCSNSTQVEARVLGIIVCCLFLYVGLFFSIMKKGRIIFKAQYWKYALKFNLPLVPHYLSQIILNQSDRLMISRMCGNAQAAYYSVAYSLAMVMLIFNNAVSSTMNPWIYKSIKNEEYSKIGQSSYLILIAIALINFLMVAMGPELLTLMAPKNYQSAIGVIPPVAVSVYFMFLYNLFATFEYYFEKTKFVMVASGIGAVINILLNYICIPKFGFSAAGYTTLVCYILYSIAHYLLVKKICKKYLPGEHIYNIKIILFIGVALVLTSGAIMTLYKFVLVRYILISCIFLTAFICRKRFMSILKEFSK